MRVLDKEFRCSVAEGPLWDVDHNRLLFLDILGECIFKYDCETKKTEKIQVGQQIGCMAICENGDLLLAMEDGIYRMNHEGEMTLAHQPIAIKGKRFNDGKVGPDGCFYVGTADDNANGAFYRLKDGILEELFDGCSCSNGLDWSMDETKMFYCDTPLQRIEVFDFDAAAHNISNRRTFVEIAEESGCPDGFTIDSEDNIWLGLWNGGAVIEIKKDGSFGEKIEVPVRKASSCCFGGDHLNYLFITSASKEDADNYPLSGYVFEIEKQIRGKQCFKYKG